MYIEPFWGSGAVFFSLQPKEVILSDINKELINLYVIMRDNPKELKGQIIYHQERHQCQNCVDVEPSDIILGFSV